MYLNAPVLVLPVITYLLAELVIRPCGRNLECEQIVSVMDCIGTYTYGYLHLSNLARELKQQKTFPILLRVLVLCYGSRSMVGERAW